MHRRLALATPLLLAGSLLAQSSFVVPSSAAGALGGASAGFPFSYTDYVLYQQAIDPSLFPGPVLLFGMSLRVETPASIQSVPDPAYQGLRVTLSDCTVPVGQLSGTFGNNVGANAQVVFDGVVPVQKGNPADPLEWNVTIPFKSPYAHANTAPLLVEIFPTSYQGQTCNGGGNGTSFDGATDAGFATVLGKGPCGTGPTTGSVAGNTGFVIRFYTGAVLMPYGKACPGSGGTTATIGSGGGNSAVGNGSFTVTLSGATGAGAGAIFIGASNTTFAGMMLPIELDGYGMPSCYLHQDLLLTLPIGLPGGMVSVPFGIPGDPSLSGQSIFTQFGVVDFPANPTGVTTSQGGWIWIR